MKQRTSKVRERITSENRGCKGSVWDVVWGYMQREGSKKCKKCDFSANFLDTSQLETNECGCAGGKGEGRRKNTHKKQRVLEGEKTAVLIDRGKSLVKG